MKILITGKNGQLASELQQVQFSKSDDIIFSSTNNIDFLNTKNIYNKIEKIKPDFIINCAAYTNVESAENDFEKANTLNHLAVVEIAKWCKMNKCKLIHLSTDYVFDGMQNNPISEHILPKPINSYGQTKYLGEEACLEYNPNSIIIRTSWLYSQFGDNFVKNIINQMINRREVSAISDNCGSPTNAEDLANLICRIVYSQKWFPGIYNFSNKGSISTYDFVNEINSLCDFDFSVVIKPINSKDYSSIVKRPKYSVLCNKKINKVFKIRQIDYRSSLKKCIVKIKNHHKF